MSLNVGVKRLHATNRRASENTNDNLQASTKYTQEAGEQAKYSKGNIQASKDTHCHDSEKPATVLRCPLNLINKQQISNSDDKNWNETTVTQPLMTIKFRTAKPSQ